MYATGQVSRPIADTANTLSARRRTPAAPSDRPDSTASPATLPAVSAAFSTPMDAPANTANSSAANGG